MRMLDILVWGLRWSITLIFFLLLVSMSMVYFTKGEIMSVEPLFSAGVTTAVLWYYKD
jgi:hypothetical protein